MPKTGVSLRVVQIRCSRNRQVPLGVREADLAKTRRDRCEGVWYGTGGDEEVECRR